MQWDGFDETIADFHPAGDMPDCWANGFETVRAAGKSRALDGAIPDQSPTYELFSPSNFFAEMNAGVDGMVYAQQQYPAIPVSQPTDRSKRIIVGLCLQGTFDVDTGKRQDRMGCAPGAEMVAHDLR